ncbi:mobilization protein [Pararhizobium sp. DWP1-1-3]|uniref:mobilization protein n=1 Tax=Pararhizobium sp. DWP1-1-3 TaxID=2804652 RepID=UPI003CF9D909
MGRKPIVQRIAELEQRKKSLVARLGKQERARDTRRKILLGAFVLRQLEHSRDPALSHWLRERLSTELSGFLVRDGDRALFDDILLPASWLERSSRGNPE